MRAPHSAIYVHEQPDAYPYQNAAEGRTGTQRLGRFEIRVRAI